MKDRIKKSWGSSTGLAIRSLGEGLMFTGGFFGIIEYFYEWITEQSLRNQIGDSDNSNAYLGPAVVFMVTAVSLYNLHQRKDHITKENKAISVESDVAVLKKEMAELKQTHYSPTNDVVLDVDSSDMHDASVNKNGFMRLN